MKQAEKLKICNLSLVFLSVAVLASGIQLEVLHGTSKLWTWVHIALCTLFMVLCGWHIMLHFKRSNWFSRFRKLRSQATKVLWWTALATLLSGILAAMHWLPDGGAHGAVGAVHGKIGFLMIILVGAHAAKRRKFYKHL